MVTIIAITAKVPTTKTLVFNNLGLEVHVLVDRSSIYPAIEENAVRIVTKFPVASSSVSKIDIHTTTNEINPRIIKYLHAIPSSLKNSFISSNFYYSFYHINHHHNYLNIVTYYNMSLK